MAQSYRNIYQKSREIAGKTQERAAEYLDISVESLRAYESDKRIPPDDVVIRMVDVYDSQLLAFQHLKYRSELGQKYLPAINIKDLSTAVLRLQKEVNDFMKCRDEIIEITCDGQITEEERPRWEQILKELNDINEAIMSVKFAKEVSTE